ncbi:MAG: 2-oxoglutarate dehydrogenase, E2 component, dihydrolipoamide succinyltransferase [Bacteroidota bacterium]
MSIEVVMPKMGESIQEGKILRWVKNVGDKVERDEVILEISTDKVDTEVPSPAAGVISQILFQEGDTVEVGKVICILGDSVGASAPAPVAAAPAPAPAPAPAAAPAPAPAAAPAPAPVSGGATVDVVMPKMGESIQEGKVLRWVKKPGDKVERDEVLLEISTEKVDTEVPSPSAGTLLEVLAAEGDVVEVGKVIARLSSGAAAAASAPAPAPSVAAPAPVAAAPVPASVPAPAPAPANGVVNIAAAATSSVPRQSGSRFYSPLVRSIAAVEGVTVQELDSISGSGIEGRVTKADIMGYLARRTPGAAPAVAPAPASAPSAAPVAVDAFPTLNIPAGADTEIIPMDRVRQLIAEHMVRSKHTSPHVTSIAEADVTGIVKLRDKMKDAFGAREGFKLTYNPFFGYAVCEGVKAFPRINVSVDGKNIIQHRRVNLGMATALPDGNLIVPVIKGAENLNVTGVARMMNDLANKARTKKLTPDDIAGGTITVTNVGSFGSLFGTPVINQPQTAIVGIGAIQKRPVVRELDGEDVVVVRSMVYLSITYDHRVIDGALATQALAAMVRALESINEGNTAL